MIVPQEIYHPLYEDKEKFIILPKIRKQSQWQSQLQ